MGTMGGVENVGREGGAEREFCFEAVGKQKQNTGGVVVSFLMERKRKKGSLPRCVLVERFIHSYGVKRDKVATCVSLSVANSRAA
jgi:hypothetical protein